VRFLALALLALVLTGCETTAEKSAELEREAARHGATAALAPKALEILHPSKVIEILRSSLVHSSEGTAAVVTLLNRSPRSLREIPLSITVRSPQGSVLYTNTTAGLSPSLQTVPLLRADSELTWVDDQVQGATTATATVSAKAGEGAPMNGALPGIALKGAHLFSEATGSGVQGTVVNQSPVPQRELVVYVVARLKGEIVAAGRAVLAQLPANGALPFQAFLIGNPRGAQLQLSAPASTLP
jgi:hypothetical protein